MANRTVIAVECFGGSAFVYLEFPRPIGDSSIDVKNAHLGSAKIRRACCNACYWKHVRARSRVQNVRSYDEPDSGNNQFASR